MTLQDWSILKILLYSGRQKGKYAGILTRVSLTLYVCSRKDFKYSLKILRFGDFESLSVVENYVDLRISWWMKVDLISPLMELLVPLADKYESSNHSK